MIDSGIAEPGRIDRQLDDHRLAGGPRQVEALDRRAGLGQGVVVDEHPLRAGPSRRDGAAGRDDDAATERLRGAVVGDGGHRRRPYRAGVTVLRERHDAARDRSDPRTCRPMPGRVYLVRHGETSWSLERRHTSFTDVALTAEGRERAAALAPVLAALPGIATADVFTSPRRRARDTCALAGLGDRAVVDDDLAEWNYGEYEGTRTADLRVADPEWSIWTASIDRGETLDEVARRVDRVIARAAAVHDGTDGPQPRAVVLFAHAHLLRILAARWCGWPAAAGEHLTLLPASISVLDYERDVRVIEHWNAGAMPT